MILSLIALNKLSFSVTNVVLITSLKGLQFHCFPAEFEHVLLIFGNKCTVIAKA